MYKEGLPNIGKYTRYIFDTQGLSGKSHPAIVNITRMVCATWI